MKAKYFQKLAFKWNLFKSHKCLNSMLERLKIIKELSLKWQKQVWISNTTTIFFSLK